MTIQLTETQSMVIDEVTVGFIDIVKQFSASGFQKRVMADTFVNGILSGELSETECLEKLDKIPVTVDHALHFSMGSIIRREMQAPFRKTMLHLYRLINDRAAREQLMRGTYDAYTDELDELVRVRLTQPWTEFFVAHFPRINDELLAALREDMDRAEAEASTNNTWRVDFDLFEFLPDRQDIVYVLTRLGEQSREQYSAHLSEENRGFQSALATCRSLIQENFSTHFAEMDIHALRSQFINSIKLLTVILVEAYSRLLLEYNIQSDNVQVIDLLTGNCEMSFHLSTSAQLYFALQQLSHLINLSDDDLDTQLRALPTLITSKDGRTTRVPNALRIYVRQTLTKVAEYLNLHAQTKLAIEAWVGNDSVREKYFYEGLLLEMGAEHFQKLVGDCVTELQRARNIQLTPEDGETYMALYADTLRDLLGDEHTPQGQLNSAFLLLSIEHDKLKKYMIRNNEMCLFAYFNSNRYTLGLAADTFEFDRSRASYFPWLAVERPTDTTEMTLESLKRLMEDDTIDTSELSQAESKDHTVQDSEEVKVTVPPSDEVTPSNRLSVLGRLAQIKVAQAFGEYTNSCLPGCVERELDSAQNTDVSMMKMLVAMQFMSNFQMVFETPSVAPLVLGQETTGIVVDTSLWPDVIAFEAEQRQRALESITASFLVKNRDYLPEDVTDAANLFQSGHETETLNVLYAVRQARLAHFAAADDDAQQQPVVNRHHLPAVLEEGARQDDQQGADPTRLGGAAR